MSNFLIPLIQAVGQVLTLVIIADALMSFFLPPDQPIRATLGRILNPMYAPIRRILPSAGGMDFSPIILVLIIQVVETLLISLLASLR